MAEEYYLGELGSEYMLSSVERDVQEVPERIMRQQRLASGKLVRDVVAVKRTYKFSYKDLPGLDANVADSGLGRNSIRDLFDDGGSLSLLVPQEVGGFESVTVYFEGYQEDRKKVIPYYQWDLDFTLVEE